MHSVTSVDTPTQPPEERRRPDSLRMQSAMHKDTRDSPGNTQGHTGSSWGPHRDKGVDRLLCEQRVVFLHIIRYMCAYIIYAERCVAMSV